MGRVKTRDAAWKGNHMEAINEDKGIHETGKGQNVETEEDQTQSLGMPALKDWKEKGPMKKMEELFKNGAGLGEHRARKRERI